MNDLSPLLHRREFFAQSVFTALGCAVGSTNSPVLAQTDSKPVQVSTLDTLNRFPRMMQDWLVTEVRAAEARGNETGEIEHEGRCRGLCEISAGTHSRELWAIP